MKTFRNPADIHAPQAAYSHQVELKGPERLLVLSGQVGMRPEGTVPEDPTEQIEVAMINIVRNLQAAEMEVADLIKVTLYLVGEIDPPKRRAALAAVLGAHEPCMTLIYVTALANPAYKIEIDAWASRQV